MPRLRAFFSMPELRSVISISNEYIIDARQLNEFLGCPRVERPIDVASGEGRYQAFRTTVPYTP